MCVFVRYGKKVCCNNSCFCTIFVSIIIVIVTGTIVLNITIMTNVDFGGFLWVQGVFCVFVSVIGIPLVYVPERVCVCVFLSVCLTYYHLHLQHLPSPLSLFISYPISLPLCLPLFQSVPHSLSFFL